MRVRSTLARMGKDVAHEVVVNVLAAVALAAIAFVFLGGRIEDLYTLARGPAPVSGQVTVLAIDEEALYLWDPTNPEPEVTPRALLAELVQFLSAAGASVVVLDILTDLPGPGDDPLGRAVATHPRLVLAERFAPRPGGLPFAAGSVFGDQGVTAYANLGLEEQTLFSGEMLVRSAPLVTRVARARLTAPFPSGLVGGRQDDAGPMPALAFAAASLHARDAAPTELQAALETQCPTGPCAVGLEEFGLPPSPVPLDAPLTLNFRGPEGADGLPYVSAARLLRSTGEVALARTLGLDLPLTVPDDLAPLFADRVVVVGRVDAASGDRFVTPYSFPALQTADMSGVRIHAQLIDTLLTGHHVRRVGRWGVWGIALVVGGLCVVTRRSLGDIHLLAWLAVGGLLVAACALLFAQTDGLVVDLGPTLAVLSATLVAVHLYQRNEDAE